jgi:integrase
MPSLLWRKGIAQVQYYVHGKAKLKSLRTKDRAIANKRFREFSARHELDLIGLSVEQPIPTLQYLFDDYLLFAQTHRKERTYKSAKQHVTDKLGPYFGSMTATELSPKHIEAFVSQLLTWKPLPYHPRTINAHLETLRKILRRAVENRDISVMPCKIGMLKTPKSLPRYAYPQEITQWMEQLDIPHRIRAIVSLMTGISDRDLGFVEKHGIDLHNLLLRYRRPKTTTDIVIPVTPAAGKMLEVLAREGSGPMLFSAKSAKKAFRLASDRVAAKGGRRITPHMLRHSFGTWLASLRVPAVYIQQMMGHADISTTMRYVKAIPEHLREAVEHLGQTLVNVDTLLTLPEPDWKYAGQEWSTEMREAQRQRMMGNKRGQKHGRHAGKPRKRKQSAIKPKNENPQGTS